MRCLDAVERSHGDALAATVAQRNFRCTPPFATLRPWPRPVRPVPRRSAPTTIADIAELTGVSVPTVSKVINGRSDVSAETRRRVETAIREHGYQRSPGSRPRTPLLEVIFHELESEWALEIVRGVERVAGQHHLAVVLSEMQGRRIARSRLDRGRARPPADRRDRGLLRPERVDARAARDARHPVRRRRPDRRAAPRHAVDRGDELERRPDRDAPSAVARPPADRRDRRAGVDPVQPRPPRRLSGGDGRGRRPDRTRTSSATASSTSRRASTAAGRCCASRTARRRSSPATTCRPWASTRPRARPVSTSPRTSASSGSTTCRSPSGSVRR